RNQSIPASKPASRQAGFALPPATPDWHIANGRGGGRAVAVVAPIGLGAAALKGLPGGAAAS
ncbi:MAG: hypothetical protein ACRDJN_18045, partial [Chloroflexota bacterium]